MNQPNMNDPVFLAMLSNALTTMPPEQRAIAEYQIEAAKKGQYPTVEEVQEILGKGRNSEP